MNSTDLRTYLRDLSTKRWAIYESADWLTEYQTLLTEALKAQAGTLGGQLLLTGTAERGRITVCDTAGAVVIDVDWMTMTAAEVAASQG